MRIWRRVLPHHLLALRVHAAELTEQCHRLPLLLGAEVLDHFHAIEHPLLLLRRHGVEVLQTVSELLLALLRKLAEVLILLESPLLLLGRKAHGVAQPVAVVRALSANDLVRHGRWRERPQAVRA